MSASPVTRAGALLRIAPLALLSLAFVLATAAIGRHEATIWWWAGIPFWEMPLGVGIMASLIPFAVLLAPDGALAAVSHSGHELAARVRRLPRFWQFSALLLLLWGFRQTDVRYGDSIFYARELVPVEASSIRGINLSYDEMLTSSVGSLGYRYLNQVLHADPVTAYNLLFLAITFAFCTLLASLRRESPYMLRAVPFLVMLAGCWNQVWMGPMEHYGPVAICLFAFAMFAVDALRGDGPLWRACLAFSVGAAFHLSIGWFFPALVFLVWKCWRRASQDERLAAVVCLVLPAIIYLCIAYFFGFDLAFFFKSHASQVKLLPLLKRNDPYIAKHIFYDSVFEWKRIADLLILVFVMGLPGLACVAALAPGMKRDFLARAEAQFALALALCGLAFVFLWNNELAMYIDKDLFGIVGLPICLVGALLAGGEDGAGSWMGPEKRRVLFAILAFAFAWRIATLLHHSVLSPNYAQPWIVNDRIYY